MSYPFLYIFSLFAFLIYCRPPATVQKKTSETTMMSPQHITPGADRLDQYLPLLKGKKVALFANQTSMVGHTFLVDTLIKKGVQVKVIFGPEHGFRGNAADGAKIENAIDKATGIPVVSLYGKKTKPSDEDLKDVDIMVFDIQDVGTRFYTFISSLQYYMEAALEHNLPLLILDRPNPNGFYVDGPVLEEKYKSFVGMQPVPVVYGMTIGEYAQMLLGEGWLSEAANAAYQRIKASRYKAGATYFRLEVIPCANYTHNSHYQLPVRPSPNLPDIQSIYLYPSNCFFEATVISEGRGTPKPFQYIGHPSLPHHLFSFTPHSNEGAPAPKYKDEVCYGWDLSGTPQQVLEKIDQQLQLKWLMDAYKLFPDKEHFFKENNGFNRLAGNAVLMEQIKAGTPESEIRKSWQPALNEFKKIRKRYLLYDDFK